MEPVASNRIREKKTREKNNSNVIAKKKKTKKHFLKHAPNDDVIKVYMTSKHFFLF